MYTLVLYLAIVNKILRHCHSWLARQYVETYSYVVFLQIGYQLIMDVIYCKTRVFEIQKPGYLAGFGGYIKTLLTNEIYEILEFHTT